MNCQDITTSFYWNLSNAIEALPSFWYISQVLLCASLNLYFKFSFRCERLGKRTCFPCLKTVRQHESVLYFVCRYNLKFRTDRSHLVQALQINRHVKHVTVWWTRLKYWRTSLTSVTIWAMRLVFHFIYIVIFHRVIIMWSSVINTLVRNEDKTLKRLGI